MKKLMYSPDALEKLQIMKQDIADRHGAEIARKVIMKITKAIQGLQQFENKGQSVESVTGISCDFRFLYVQYNYVFYRIQNDTIWILDIYHEREDFMWKLFGIRTTLKETEDYWEE